MGLTPDNDTVTSPFTKDWAEVTVAWTPAAREGHTYDPDEPVTWAHCPTPGCGDDLDEIHATFTDGTGDYDIVRCHSCGFERNI